MYEFTHRIPHQPWGKPSRNEQEYFCRLDLEARLKRAWERERRREEEERRRFMEQHRNRCPECGERLEDVRVRDQAARQCPDCLGVWLGHGLFDALTHEERSPLADMFRSQILGFSLGALREVEEELGIGKESG